MNLDYVYSVGHLVREGETIISEKLALNLEGKGLNQTLALAKTGAAVFPAGRVGLDGTAMIEALEKENVDTRFIEIDASVPTGHATIQVDSQEKNCIIVHGGANRTISKSYISRVPGNFEPGDILLVQNEINMLDYLVHAAHEKGLRIALNPSPINQELSLAVSRQGAASSIPTLSEVERCNLKYLND